MKKLDIDKILTDEFDVFNLLDLEKLTNLISMYGWDGFKSIIEERLKSSNFNIDEMEDYNNV